MQGGETHLLSSRPSDAIALAARTGSPIFAEEHVLDEVGYAVQEEAQPEEEVVEEFRRVHRRRQPRGLRVLNARIAPAGDPWRRVQLGCVLLFSIIVIGTCGYLILGLDPLDSLYQTVTTIATVGFRELPEEPSANFRIFTMALILTGVGTALYTATVLLESVVEGRLSDRIGRRRMERTIEDLTDHVMVCGWGRVGRTIERHLQGAGADLVVVESDPDRFAAVPGLKVWGDATDDAVMTEAGIDRAATVITAVDSDADNLFIALSARARRPDLFIVAGCGTRPTRPSSARPAPTGSSTPSRSAAPASPRWPARPTWPTSWTS